MTSLKCRPASNWIGDRSTRTQANALSNTVAARSPLARSMAPVASPPGLSANDIALIASVLAPKSTTNTRPVTMP